MNINTTRIRKGLAALIIFISVTLAFLTIFYSKELRISYDGVKKTDEIEKYVDHSLRLLPKQYQRKLLREGWQVVITNKDVSHFFIKECNYNLSAVTILDKRTIYVEKEMLDSLLHEFCHACLYDIQERKSYYVKYPGYKKEAEELYADSYILENYDEFIVESMARYLKDKTILDGYPVTKKTVEELLSRKWLKRKNGEDN